MFKLHIIRKRLNLIKSNRLTLSRACTRKREKEWKIKRFEWNFDILCIWLGLILSYSYVLFVCLFFSFNFSLWPARTFLWYFIVCLIIRNSILVFFSFLCDFKRFIFVWCLTSVYYFYHTPKRIERTRPQNFVIFG